MFKLVRSIKDWYGKWKLKREKSEREKRIEFLMFESYGKIEEIRQKVDKFYGKGFGNATVTGVAVSKSMPIGKEGKLPEWEWRIDA